MHSPNGSISWRVEIVVAQRVCQIRIVGVGSQHQRCSAAPPAHELGGQEFLLLRVPAIGEILRNLPTCSSSRRYAMKLPLRASTPRIPAPGERRRLRPDTPG